jgi:thiol-disulfide isomerase/thioredoxin
VIPLLLAASLLTGDVDAAGLHRAVRSERGRAVVVNFWATWCEPCVKEFPALVALARERQDIRVISVSIDDPGDRKAVEDFLQKQKPSFPVYLKAAGADEAFINGVDPKWSGAVPLTIVFDTAGKKSFFLEGEITREKLESNLPAATSKAPAAPAPSPGR